MAYDHLRSPAARGQFYLVTVRASRRALGIVQRARDARVYLGLGHAAVVDLLLAHGADAGATDPYLGKTPLQWACDGGHAAVAVRLQRHGDTTA